MTIKKGTLKDSQGNDFYPVTDATLVAGMPTALADLDQDTSHMLVSESDIDRWDDKQDQLVSGTTLKTINSASLLGSGNITLATENSVGYILRTNKSTRQTSGNCYRYRVCFTSVDGTKWVPSNTSTSSSATASKTVNQTPINPFGEIIEYHTTTGVSSGGTLSTSYQRQQATFDFGYAFNRTGAALTLTTNSPIYIKCAPQSDGSAIIDSTTPYVQTLPTTEDGKIYIYLGQATSATQAEIVMNHPIYYYKNGSIRFWTNAEAGIDVEANPTVPSGTTPTALTGLKVGSSYYSISSGSSDLFECTYGTTTQSDIATAVAAGKIPVCNYNSALYVYAGESSAGYSQFTATVYNTVKRVYVKNSTWGNNSYTAVNGNGVTSIISITESDYADLVTNDNVDENTLYIVVPDPVTP